MTTTNRAEAKPIVEPKGTLLTYAEVLECLSETLPPIPIADPRQPMRTAKAQRVTWYHFRRGRW